HAARDPDPDLADGLLPDREDAPLPLPPRPLGRLRAARARPRLTGRNSWNGLASHAIQGFLEHTRRSSRMQRTVRLTVLALASLFTLAFATSAWASYTPKLVADPKSEALNGGGPFTLTFSQPADDQATAKATIYTPKGYATDVSQALGSKLGTVKANVIAKGLGGIPLRLTGTIQTDDPAKYVSNPCAPGTHQAVWLMVLTASNQTLQVPMYVDSITSGPEAAFASMKIQVCLPSPDVPPEQGGATFGAKLVTAQLNFAAGVFTNPGTRGAYLFRAIATPYDVNSGTVRPDQTVEARGLVLLPVGLSLTAKAGRRGTVILSGAVSAAGRAAAATVRLFA